MGIVTIEQWNTDTDTRPPCASCRQLHGQRFVQGEGPEPPLHPNCGCSRRVVERIDDRHPAGKVRIGLIQAAYVPPLTGDRP